MLSVSQPTIGENIGIFLLLRFCLVIESFFPVGKFSYLAARMVSYFFLILEDPGKPLKDIFLHKV